MIGLALAPRSWAAALGPVRIMGAAVALVGVAVLVGRLAQFVNRADAKQHRSPR